MSGRSAYVRKEKTKVKDGPQILGLQEAHPEVRPDSDGTISLGDFPMPGINPYHHNELPFRGPEVGTIRTQLSTGSDEMVYARARRPHVPILEVSGIEKSSFRAFMDNKSESARKSLASAFKKKKKGTSAKERPETATGRRQSQDPPDYDNGDYITSPSPLTSPSAMMSPAISTPRVHQETRQVAPPPTAKLPATPRLQQFIGGKPPIPWNKLRRDPDLWDRQGDVIVIFLPNSPPSLRLTSHVIESHPSRRVMEWLMASSKRYSSIQEPDRNPSPDSSNSGFGNYPVQLGRRQPSPPKSTSDLSYNEAEISYTIDLTEQLTMEKTDRLKLMITCRNFFALIYNIPLVGLSLRQALVDLQEFIDRYIDETASVNIVADYISKQNLDNIANNPAAATAMLAYYMRKPVQDKMKFREAFCHCVGMFEQCQNTPDWRHVSAWARSAIEQHNSKMILKALACEKRLLTFRFDDMWPVMSSESLPSREACERFRLFLLKYYTGYYGTWPPPTAPGSELWLDRRITQHLQKDFAALYDYLVNREVIWDGAEERSGRKWNLKLPGKPRFQADTKDLPMTDILVAFDNRHEYPHIPHPYPLTPETTNVNELSHEDDKMTQRMIALAYTAATNIYRLGSKFVENEMVSKFVQFEKTDFPGDLDPFAARRGRWVLIYAILQTLASISVDNPGLVFADNVAYHVYPSLKGCPPWKPDPDEEDPDMKEAHHTMSHCWTVRKTWGPDRSEPFFVMVNQARQNGISSRSSATLSVSPSEYSNSSGQSPTLGSAQVKPIQNVTRGKDQNPIANLNSHSGYGPGIEVLEEEYEDGLDEEEDLEIGEDQFEYERVLQQQDFARPDSPTEHLDFNFTSRNQNIQPPQYENEPAHRISRRKESPQSFGQVTPDLDSKQNREFRRQDREQNINREDSRRRDVSEHSWTRGDSRQGFNYYDPRFQTREDGADFPIRDFDNYKI
jgi:hypothetical protein